MRLKPLGIIREIVESAGMGISYAYEDLVFIEHNAFLLQFTDSDNELLIHVNSEADESLIQGDIIRLKAEAASRKIVLGHGQIYTLRQDGEENVRLEFSDRK